MIKSLVFLLVMFPITSLAQDSVAVLGQDLFVKVEIIEENEWGTTDTLQVVYPDFSKDVKPLIEYYSFKDQGGDCNNLFWMRESLEIKDGQWILLSHRFQKTGIDPIPEWRKRIFVMNENNELELIYDRYKYFDSDEWVSE